MLPVSRKLKHFGIFSITGAGITVFLASFLLVYLISSAMWPDEGHRLRVPWVVAGLYALGGKELVLGVIASIAALFANLWWTIKEDAAFEEREKRERNEKGEG